MPSFRRNPVHRAIQTAVQRSNPLPRQSFAAGVIAPAVLVIGSGGVWANEETTVWTGATDDDWFTEENWDPEAVPDNETYVDLLTDADEVHIPDSGENAVADTVGVAGHEDTTLQVEGTLETEQALRIGTSVFEETQGYGTVTIESEGELNVDGLGAGFGEGKLARLEVESGATFTNDGFAILALEDGSEAEVTVEGEWTNAGELTVGRQGEATVTVQGDGEVTAEESVFASSFLGQAGSAEVTVKDGARWETEALSVGQLGSAEMRIEDGATVEVNDDDGEATTIIGTQETGTGTIIVTGDDSEMETDMLAVSQEGVGSMVIESGGSVTVQEESHVAREDGSSGSVTVSGEGSSWNTDTLRIGRSGKAELQITEGGSVESDGLSFAGVQSGSSASVSVAGTGSRWSAASSIRIGSEGEAELDIQDGGAVNSNSGWIGFNEGGVGEVRLSGGNSSWSVSNELTVGLNGDALLHVGDDAEVQAGSGIWIARNEGSSAEAVVNGFMSSDDVIRVGTGGVLRGDGVVSGDTVVEGMLAPGNSIGSLAVGNGDLEFAGGSVYRVEVNDGGDEAGVNNDFVTVEGNIVISEDASLHVTSESGTDDGSTYAPETTYNILSAEQEVQGEFSEVTDDFAFLSPSLEYGEDAVFLTLTQVADLGDVARTPNQRAVGTALDTQVKDQGANTITSAILSMDEDQARAALDDLSGVEHTHVQQIGLRGAQRFRSGLNGRMSGRSSGPAFGEMASLDQLMGLQLASAGQARDLVEGESGPNRGWWVTAEGGRGDIDDTSNASGADYDFGGISVGFDTPVSDNVFVGAAMGYTRNRASTASGDLDVDSFHLAGYGGWQQDALYARGSLGVGYHRADSERSVATLNETATADYSARGIGTGIEVGYVFEVTDVARVTPFGGLDYEYLRRSSFSESGAGAANLDVDSESEYSLRSQAGVRFDQTFDTTGGWVAPYAEAAWVHEHGDRASRMDTAFSGNSAGRFTIEGPRLSRNRARIALGVQSQLNSNSFLNAGYQGEIAGSDDLHAIGVSFRRTW